MHATKKSAAKPRVLRPVDPVQVAPTCVSQLTCLALLGLNPSRYLEHLAKHPKFPRHRVGKLVLTDPRDWLRAVAPVADGEAEPQPDASEGDLATVDEVLAVLGRRRKAPSGGSG